MNMYTMKLEPEKSMTQLQMAAMELVRSAALECDASYKDGKGNAWVPKNDLVLQIIEHYDKSKSTAERYIALAEGHTIIKTKFGGKVYLRPSDTPAGVRPAFACEPSKSSRIRTLAKMLSDLSEMEDMVTHMSDTLSSPDLWGDDRAVVELIRVIKDMAWSTANACDELGLLIEYGQEA